MDDRQMLLEVLKDIESIDKGLDEIRAESPTLNQFDSVVDMDKLDAEARFVVDVKRKLAKYLAGQ